MWMTCDSNIRIQQPDNEGMPVGDDEDVLERYAILGNVLKTRFPYQRDVAGVGGLEPP